MGLLPIRLMPIAWTVLAIVGIGFAWWLLDIVRESGKTEVRTQFAEAARKKNITITESNSADEVMAAVQERAVTEAEIRARGILGQCPATQEQAAALTAIRRAR